MEIYTVCVDGLPVLVMSVGVQPPMEDSGLKNPEFLKAHRSTQGLVELINAKVVEGGGSLDEFRHICAIREIDEIRDAWLESELQGRGLWNGEPDQVSARKATLDEAAKWRSSYEAAIAAGEADAGDEDWLVYLVPGIAEQVEQDEWLENDRRRGR